jgi:PAS domain S-box-containing protein
VTAAGRAPAPPLPVEQTDLIPNEWVRWGLLAGLGAAASYLSVTIPNTNTLIEGRWIFGYVGFAILHNGWAALLLACFLSITRPYNLPLTTVFIGNMLYALPILLIIRTLHSRVLDRLRRPVAYGAAWFAMIMICYQLFTTPVVWGILAFLDGAPVGAGMVEGWRIQPYFVESLLVAVVSASLMMVVRSQQSLRDSRQELATTLYSIGDGVITTDTQGRIRRMNPTAEALTGWRESEAVGQPLETVFRIVDEETRAAVDNPVRRAMHEGSVVGLSNHTLLITRDGTRRPIMDSAAPIRDAEGHVSGVILVFQDQTEERAAQRALEASRARLLLALRRARMGIWDWDVTTDGVAWYGEYASIFGTPLAEFGGTLEDVRARIHPDDRAEGLALLRRAVETGEAFTNTYRTVWPDGSIHWAHSYGAPITDKLGRTQRVIGTIQDVTERRMIEQQLRRQERLATVGQLAAGIAHDFRNLLSTIILYAQLPMMDEELPPQLHQHLRTIVDESYKASDLVQQLLDFASQAIIERQPLDLVALVEDVLGVLKRTIPEHIHFIVEIEEARPGAYTVAVDPGRIQQALTNLTLNARDAMPEGGDLRVTIARLHVSEGSTPPVAEMAPGDWVRLTVSDTGVGMTEDVQAHLFEPFFTTKEVGEGTGLGLAQVFGIVRQHEGHIDVETAPGDGTTFNLYLPAHALSDRGAHL